MSPAGEFVVVEAASTASSPSASIAPATVSGAPTWRSATTGTSTTTWRRLRPATSWSPPSSIAPCSSPQSSTADDNSRGNVVVSHLERGPSGSPAVAMATDLDFVVVWPETRLDANHVIGRRFTGSGEPIEGEFAVSTDTASAKGSVDVAGAPDGSFVAVWRSDGQDGDAGGIFGQRFDGAGRRLGREFRVNSAGAHDQSYPAVAMRAEGDFVVAWTSQHGDGSEEGVFLQAFDDAGQASGRGDPGQRHHPGGPVPSRGGDRSRWKHRFGVDRPGRGGWALRHLWPPVHRRGPRPRRRRCARRFRQLSDAIRIPIRPTPRPMATATRASRPTWSCREAFASAGTRRSAPAR